MGQWREAALQRRGPEPCRQACPCPLASAPVLEVSSGGFRWEAPEAPPSRPSESASTCLEARSWERFPKSTLAMSDGDINPPKLLLKMECSRSHNSSLIVKELIKPTAPLLTGFYCVIFSTGQAKSGINGLTVGFWLLTKGGNDIFNEHRVCSPRTPGELPAGACQFPPGQDLAAGHHLPGLVQGSPSHPVHIHTRVPVQVHACPPGTKQIWPTSLGGDKQAKVQFGISSLFFFKLLIKPFVLITAFSDSPKVCLPSCTSPAGSAPGPSTPVSAEPLHPQQACCTPQHMAYNPGSRWRLSGRRALAPATPVPCRPQFPGSSGVTLLTLINTLAARAVAWLPGEMAESERKPLSLNA